MNPAQHVRDLEMLNSKEELRHVFTNTETGAPKSIDLRVDGASTIGSVLDKCITDDDNKVVLQNNV